ncbi:hypothetical protein BDV3_000646 [Batrachochytrium dendrobatidis]
MSLVRALVRRRFVKMIIWMVAIFLAIICINSIVYLDQNVEVHSAMNDSDSVQPTIGEVGQFLMVKNNLPLQLKQYPPTSNELDDGNSTLPSKYFLVAAAMMYNKGDYITEWIEFHLLQGFDRFVIYDHMGTDNLSAVINPYIEAGVAEVIVWPKEFELTDLPPLGPRIWPSDDIKESFETSFKRECLEIKDLWHIHGGCQRTAMQDAIARYRNRTEWITVFDVDEFFYVSKTGNETADTASITTVRDVLMSKGKDYDHIKVPGKIFGTSGFLHKPISQNGLPNRLVTEAYRYRVNTETGQRHEELFMAGRSYCEKSFARISTVTSTVIHHFTFDHYESEGNTVRELTTGNELIDMNHYQYLSHYQQNFKAFVNTNWNIFYWRPVEMLFCETLDYSVGYLVPLVDYNLRVRYHYDRLKTIAQKHQLQDSPHFKNHRNSVSQFNLSRKPFELCIAFTHVNNEAHKLRRAINTILHHMINVEPDITFKTVLVMNHQSAPQEPTKLELEYLHDIVSLFDEIEVLPKLSPWTIAMDRATERCKSAQYTLFMEDNWETRIYSGSISDYSRPGLNLPMIRHAMHLMDHEKNILEVWLGDTPIDPPAYEHVRSGWIKATFLPPLDRNDSNFRLLQKQIYDDKLKNAVWKDTFDNFLKEKKIKQRFMQYAKDTLDLERRDQTPFILSSEGDEDYSVEQKRDLSQVDQDLDEFDYDDAVVESDKPVEIKSRERSAKLLADFYKSAKLRLNCFPQIECPSRITYIRVQGMQGGSGLSVVRLGGTIKNNQRLATLPSWNNIADNAKHQSPLVIQEMYGQEAISRGFKSAHICLTTPGLQAECNLDPDYMSDEVVTGIMWRQRILLDKDRTGPAFPDRPMDV